MASQPRFDYVQAEASNNEFTVAHQDGMMWVTCSTCNGAVREPCLTCLDSRVELVPCRCSECCRTANYTSRPSRSDNRPRASRGGRREGQDRSSNAVKSSTSRRTAS